jgi:hypothetical protein
MGSLFNLFFGLYIRLIYWASRKIGTWIGIGIGFGFSALRDKLDDNSRKRTVTTQPVNQLAAEGPEPFENLFITPQEAIRQNTSARSRYLPG